MKLTFYYVVTKQGRGRLFEDMPVRNEHFGVWEGKTSGFLTSFILSLEDRGIRFPELSFNDEPYPITLEVSL